jgi:hypothetical protein
MAPPSPPQRASKRRKIDTPRNHLIEGWPIPGCAGKNGYAGTDFRRDQSFGTPMITGSRARTCSDVGGLPPNVASA